ncbi:MAG: PEP-CTERM sorting domain-containing protein [Microcystis sp.]
MTPTAPAIDFWGTHRTMHIDCSCGFKCDAAPPAQTPEPSALVGLGAVVALGAGFKRRPTQADKN